MDESWSAGGSIFSESASAAAGSLRGQPRGRPLPRFRSDLSVILGLLEERRGSVRDDLVVASLDWLEERVFTIASIYELCLGLGRGAGVPFQDLCESLVSRALALSRVGTGGRSFVIHGSDFLLGEEAALRLGLAVEELVTSCLGHSPPPAVTAILRIELMDFPEGLVDFRVIGEGGGSAPFRDEEKRNFELTRRLIEGLGGCFILDDFAGIEVLALLERSRLSAAADDRPEGTGVTPGS